ncbi:MAG: SDR family NAD(P)-dependent oxidoreductase [Ruminococcaceae bacterium]|nr:SDR family NAD(P)-dependent oxidoreductase [Oscillospiraceae bacterium]
MGVYYTVDVPVLQDKRLPFPEEIKMSLQKLAEMSNKYGANPDYVLAGGGNTSYKDDTRLYVKGSGTSLATIRPEQFVIMDRAKLTAMMDATYPDNDADREAAALADMMAARLPSEMNKRPSVETTLHNLFPYHYVLHTHPALVNGLCCGANGKQLCKDLFGDVAVFVEACRPGYVLAKICNEALNAAAANGKFPQMLFLQNHGVFVAADTTEEIDTIMGRIFSALNSQVSGKPDFDPDPTLNETAAELAPIVRMLYGEDQPATALYFNCRQAQIFLSSEEAFAPLAKPFTPDHIVYCKAFFLFVKRYEDPAEQKKALCTAFAEYRAKHGHAPKVVGIEKLGFFLCGKTVKEARIAKLLLTDAMKIAVFSKGFGGYLHMTQDLTDFIVNWEVESYRQKIGLGSGSSKCLENKIAVVTGSAQGFGKGIAYDMAKQGAYLVIADMNKEGADAFAAQLCEEFGDGAAISVFANVSDEDSVRKMMEETVLAFGGLDIFVNNAGIVRAGSLDEMTKSNFELVTAVNYTAYFLCAKYASKVLKAQNSVSPDYMTDIIEINSKSGLAGSNKNFAYAGSKFGGIGLTQSFAMELAPYNIKVNAICPGNFLEGPLWSDPEKGLFVQYLNAGKVPGATCVEDVKKFYESKVPLNRGCRPEDVSCAIFYVVAQKYETGQAIPVTGGQEMLK